MKNTKILMILLMMVALLLTAKVALAAPTLAGPYEAERTAIEDVSLADNWDDDLQFIDGNLLTYSLESEPQGMEVEQKEDGSLNIIWESPVKGTHEDIILIADDGVDKTEVKFNLTVDPFLKLEITNIDAGTDVNPGDVVTVTGTYTNNGDDSIIKIDINSEADMTVAELPFEDDDWWLPIGETVTFDFTFTIPELTDEETFDLTTSIEGLSIFGKEYEDENVTMFNITKESFSAVISSAELDSETLSCNKETNLDLEIINKGEEDIVEAYILVYEKPVEKSSFDEDGKNFTKFADGKDAKPILQQKLDDITPTTKEALSKSFELELESLSKDDYDLQIYLVSPAFGDNNFIASQDTVKITIEDCNPLQIKEISVKVGDEDFSDLINASPGDEVEVTVTFGNDGEETIGHTTINVVSTDGDLEFFPYTAECDGAECDEGQWTLLSGKKKEHTFKFTIPTEVTGDFDLTVQVLDELVDGSKQESEEETLEFTVIKNDADIVIKEMSIVDKTLTCARLTTLKLELTNSGSNPVAPEVLVYSKEPSADNFNEDDGEFTFSEEPLVSEEYTHIDKIDSSDTETAEVMVNTTELANGEHTLFVYVVNPFFADGEKYYFVSDGAEVKINVGDCLNVNEINDALETSKNDDSPTKDGDIDFFEINDEGEYVYIFEDVKINDVNNYYEASLTFQIAEDDEEEGIVGQSNLDLITCNNPETYTLSCLKPEQDQSGTSELIIEVVQDLDGETNKISDTVEVNVYNTLSISNVKINNDLIEEGETSEPLNPFDEIEVKLTVTNHLDYAVTGVVANIFSDQGKIDIDSEEKINLEAKQSKEISFKDQLSYILTEEKYEAELSVSGVDHENNAVENDKEDVFEFTLDLEQEAADLEVSELIVDEELLAGDDWEGFTCDPTATVRMVLTNKGINIENDVVVTITGAGEEIEFDLEEVDENGNGEILPNTQETYSIDVPTRDLNSGSNTLKFEISYRNGYDSHSATVPVLKNDCFKEAQVFDEETQEWLVDETGEGWILADEDGRNDNELELEVILNEDNYENVVDWYVFGEEDEEDKEPETEGQDTYIFSEEMPGDYEIIADVNGEEFSWFVTVTDKPFSYLLTTNIPEDATNEDLIEFKDFTVENSFGKIVFNVPVDLTDLFDLDQVIMISEGSVSVNTVLASELNVPATITLKKNFGKHMIFAADGFDEEDMKFEVCPDPEICDVISNDENGFIFKVTEFSTYKVLEDKEAELAISEILIADKDRGESVSVDVTVTNVGSLNGLTDLTVELSGVNNDYEATVSPLTVKELKAGNSFTVKLEFTIPEDENAGEHNIGSLKVTGKNGLKVVTESTSVKINPKSHLSIDGFKVNGKTTGELELGNDENIIKVQLKNDYTEDMEDVFVTVTILDVDGNDVDEESEEVDLDEGKSEWLEVTFDLSDEELDDDSYTIEIIAEGTAADDDSEHETITTEDVDVDREDHKVVIKDLDLSASIVQCPSRHSTLEVTVENVGKKNEDVEVTVKNSALGLDETKELDLDKFSGDDPKDDAKFYLDSFLTDATAQSYPITVEVSYDDGDETESDEVTIEVKDCVQQNTASQQQANLADSVLAQQLQQQLQQQMNAKQTTPSSTSTVKTSFRGSSSYTLLLGVLVFLVLIAIMLAFAVAMKKK